MVDDAPRYPTYDYPTDDPDVETYEEKPTGYPIAPYQVGRSAGANYRELSVPLFLSDFDGRPDPSEYMPPGYGKRGSSSRILAVALACASAGILAALVSSDAARDVIASAKASSTAVLSVASAAMHPGSVQPKESEVQPGESGPVSAAEPEALGPRSVATTAVAAAVVSPTPEDIKAAYQGALQGGAPQTAAVPERATSGDVIRHLDSGEIASSLKRADALIGSGDIAAARLVLRRVAEARDGRAAMMLAGTYDPTVLEKLGVHGVVPDVAMARNWYEKAKQFGASEATSQLGNLASKQH
jgi:hypothetical protein